MNKRSIGTEYEQRAAAYLEEKGYEIIERNYRTVYGEIDLIARKKELLVFCEIKYRSTSRYGSPLEAVDRKKQKKISGVALFYCTTKKYTENILCRFDVIGIYGDGAICHIENAFDFQK